MANKEPITKQVTKKHLAKQEKERRQTRGIIIATIITSAVVLGLLGYVLIDNYIVKPNHVVASVGDTQIRVKQFEPEVKYTRLNLINQANQYYYYSQMFGEMGSNFLSTSQNILSYLGNPTTVGNEVINRLIENILIKEEASKLGITVSDEEVDKALMEAFDFYPNGTPTPSVTPTIVYTPTFSKTQIAIIKPTNTPTPLPTATSTPDGWQPTSTPTATFTVTQSQEPIPTEATTTLIPSPTLEPTITPTPTLYTTKVYGESLANYQDQLNQYGISRTNLKEIFRAQLLREKVKEAITADLKPVESQVWARHILVTTEDEALKVLEALDNGEDWVTLAATYSTDTSNKDNGGDLGWFGRGKMVSAFEDAAFSLQVGEISEPIKTDFGYHIIQCVAKGENNLNSADFDALKQTTFTNWLESKRSSRSDIVINEDWTQFTPSTPAIPSSLYNAVFSQ